MKRLLLLPLLCFAALGAQDTTPYQFTFAENSFSGSEGAANTRPATGSVADMRHRYNDGRALVSSAASYDREHSTSGNVVVNMHALYDRIGSDGQVTETDSIFYLEPSMGVILRTSAGSTPIISGVTPDGGVCFIDSTAVIGFTVSDSNGLDSLRAWLVRPDDDLILIDRTFSHGVTSYTFSLPYTWRSEDCGFNYLAIFARDNSGNIFQETEVHTMTTLYEIVEINDAVYLINYIYRLGPPPSPYLDGDANCDGLINIGDPLYIVNHIFNDGLPICCPR